MLLNAERLEGARDPALPRLGDAMGLRWSNCRKIHDTVPRDRQPGMADVRCVAGFRVPWSGGPFHWKPGHPRGAAVSHFRAWRGCQRWSLLGVLTSVRRSEPVRSKRESSELRVGAAGLNEEHAG